MVFKLAANLHSADAKHCSQRNIWPSYATHSLHVLWLLLKLICCNTQHSHPDRCDNMNVYVNSSGAVKIQQMASELLKSWDSSYHVFGPSCVPFITVWICFFFPRKLSSCQWSCEHGGPQHLKAKLDVWCIIDLMAESAGIQTQTHTACYSPFTGWPRDFYNFLFKISDFCTFICKQHFSLSQDDKQWNTLE